MHVFDLNENKHEPMCEQKIVRKAKLTRVSFNPKVKDKLTPISKPAALESGAFRWSEMPPLSSKLEMEFFVITARSPIVINLELASQQRGTASFCLSNLVYVTCSSRCFRGTVHFLASFPGDVCEV